MKVRSENILLGKEKHELQKRKEASKTRVAFKMYTKHNYLALYSIPAMYLHCLVIAVLSELDTSHRCTAPRFIENPIRPPFVFESQLAVCSIMVSNYGRH